MAKIDILLASYNGEKFIAEQLDSILAQTFQDFRILIRDDGSTDNTPVIIEEYEKKYPDKIKIIHDDVICKNPTKNFVELIKHAQADYIMFCDQDDYWLPYKIQVSYWHMKEIEKKNPGKPIYIFSGLKVVDENLNSMDFILAVNTQETEYKVFTNLILSNRVSGCTSILNKALYRIKYNGSEETTFAHDSFLGIVASICGIIELIPAAMILYRQHKNNVSGYMGVGGNRGFFMNWLKKIWGIKNAYHCKKKCSFLRKNYSDIFPPDKLKELDSFINLLNKNKILKFFMLLFGKGYKLRGRLFCKIKYFIRVVFS